jgi:hypothetical protein
MRLNPNSLDKFKNKIHFDQNQKGILTIDFIFSFAMVIGFFQLFFVITYTLMVSHLTQYMTFASARMYFAGHIDVQSQERLARQKFDQLTGSPSVSSFFRSAFALSNLEIREFTEFDTPEPYRQKYIGTRVTFQSNVLDFNVPFLGRTSTELPNGAFTSNIGSYLYREPTSSECFRFNEARGAAILQLNGKYSQAQGFGFDPNQILVSADNGC